MIVLHIGMPKAGSATIQTFLDDNAGALRDLSVDYPGTGRRGSKDHNAMVKELRLCVGNSTEGAKRLSALVSRVESSPYRTTILSAEMLSRQRRSNVKRLKSILSGSDRPFRIIMVVRDPIEQFPSIYGQKIRYGATVHDFDTFFDTRINDASWEPFEAAKLWAAVFGWETLQIRLLDSKHLLNGDLIEDFLTCSGLDPKSPEIQSLPRQERVNESSGWKCLEAGRALFSGRHGLSGDHPLNRVMSSLRLDADNARVLRTMRLIEARSADIARANGWAADKGRYLTRAQAQRCLDLYGIAIRKLNRFLTTKLPDPGNLNQRGFVEREFLPDASHIAPDELANHYAELGSRLATEGLIGRLTKSDLRAFALRRRDPAANASATPASGDNVKDTNRSRLI
jgi:hypothetical protein